MCFISKIGNHKDSNTSSNCYCCNIKYVEILKLMCN